MNTDTPRTNDAAFMAIHIDGNGVPTEFARQLERELAAAHAEIKLLKTNLEISFRQTEQAVQDRADEHQILTEQRDNLELRMEAEIGAAQHANQKLDAIVRERDEIRNQRDKLAEALHKLIVTEGRGLDQWERDAFAKAKQALAAVKGEEQ